MTSSAAPEPFEGIALSSLWIAARHRHIDGTLAVPANTASVTLTVENDVDDDPTIDGESLTVADVLAASLQTDDRWSQSKDTDTEAGFQFSYTIPPTAFPKAATYWIEVRFEDSSGNVTKAVWEGPMRSSVET